MPDYSVIDVHMHTYPTAATAIQAMGGSPTAGFTGTIEALVPFMGRVGLEKAVMVNFTPVADMMDASLANLQPNLSQSHREGEEDRIRREMTGRVKRRNRWTCQVAKEQANLLYPFIGIDLIMDRDAIVEEIHECYREGARGIKLHPVVQRFSLDDERLWPAYETAERLGMAMLIHTGPYEGQSGENARPGRFIAAAQKFPHLIVIMAHCGGREYFRDAVGMSKEYRNLFFDCCGIVPGNPEPGDPSNEDMLGLFRAIGTDRIMFGSDWCFRDPVPDIQRIERLGLSRDEQRHILRENAITILQL